MARDMSPKALYVLHAARVKHLPERTVELDKHEGSKNDEKARMKWIQTEVEHTQRAQAPPTCTQLIHGRWATGQRYQRV